MFIEKDCTMVSASKFSFISRCFKRLTAAPQVEVNPFMETTQGNICCVDSKVNPALSLQLALAFAHEKKNQSKRSSFCPFLPPISIFFTKVNFDDNAAFRQKDVHALRDFSQEDANEVCSSCVLQLLFSHFAICCRLRLPNLI
jgi:hypothetical protein